MADNPILQTKNLTIGYKQRRQAPAIIAQRLNLHLKRGQLVCLLGPNGAGKSTLMRTLAAMQPSLNGQVLLDGNDINTLQPQFLAKKLSIVLTERVQAGLLSAYDLVALGRYPYTDWRGTLSTTDTLVVRHALQAVGATALAQRPVSQLSDGERQKVMIARALAQEPHLMLLDEPTAYLDLPRRVEIMQILRQLAHEGQRAILLSTHDLDLALRSADVIWLMADGVLHVGAPEDLVLNGTFAAAFAAEGVTFDPHSGAFRTRQSPTRAIDVLGDGLTAIWTTRALQRIGYRVHSGDHGSPLQVLCEKNQWILAIAPDQRKIYPSLAALTQSLQC